MFILCCTSVLFVIWSRLIYGDYKLRFHSKRSEHFTSAFQRMFFSAHDVCFIVKAIILLLSAMIRIFHCLSILIKFIAGYLVTTTLWFLSWIFVSCVEVEEYRSLISGVNIAHTRNQYRLEKISLWYVTTDDKVVGLFYETDILLELFIVKLHIRVRINRVIHIADCSRTNNNKNIDACSCSLFHALVPSNVSFVRGFWTSLEINFVVTFWHDSKCFICFEHYGCLESITWERILSLVDWFLRVLLRTGG